MNLRERIVIGIIRWNIRIIVIGIVRWNMMEHIQSLKTAATCLSACSSMSSFHLSVAGLQSQTCGKIMVFPGYSICGHTHVGSEWGVKPSH